MLARIFKGFTNKQSEVSPQLTTYTKANKSSFPFYIKAPMVLLGLYLLFYILFILKDTLAPVCYAGLLAILLNPLVNKLNELKVKREISIILSILLAFVLFGGLIAFLASQMSSFSELAPEFMQKGNQLLHDIQIWVSDCCNISLSKQMKMITEALESSKAYIGQTVSTIAGIIGIVVLLPIYVYLILYYKPLFINFFYEVFDTEHESKVSEVLTETKSAIQSYIQGLLIEMLIVAGLNSAALLLLGVEYAILIGVVGAIINIIPYIGGLIAIAMPVAMSLVTGDGGYSTALYIIIAYTIIQFLDNNVIVPKVVSSKVEVNAFISIIVVLLGGALWGVSGMFLSIPFVAILKIIFDRIQDLKPWGMILGTQMNEDFSLNDFGSPEAAEKSVISQEIAFDHFIGEKNDTSVIDK
ncbi:AI-2E family transporter [Emticicia sp. W12TSBA100-4]|uniref:AI-2E family transporter n=1 Tax=Emticicia sp. W12TSBA100-4 TaxID=3160965 RepID=UPI0033066AC6